MSVSSAVELSLILSTAFSFLEMSASLILLIAFSLLEVSAALMLLYAEG